jgi:hypothetical protein
MEYVDDRMPVLNAVTMCFIGQMFVNALKDLSDESDEDENDDGSGHARVPRRQYPRKNYSCSQHAQMLLNQTHLDQTSRDFRDFRDIFRVPSLFFEDMVAFAARHYPHKSSDAVGRPAVPTNLKVLCCFFILSTGISFKAMAFTIGCDHETIRVFYLFFLDAVVEHLAPRVIKMPANESELAAAVDTYADQHLPGCMGSIDCTHIGWVRARSAVRSWFVGESSCMPCVHP